MKISKCSRCEREFSHIVIEGRIKVDGQAVCQDCLRVVLYSQLEDLRRSDHGIKMSAM